MILKLNRYIVSGWNYGIKLIVISIVVVGNKFIKLFSIGWWIFVSMLCGKCMSWVINVLVNNF